ncbi:hypothetical protein [Candidatus Nitrosocosmicus sp. R]
MEGNCRKIQPKVVIRVQWLEVFKKITSSSDDLDSLIKSIRTTLHNEIIPSGYRNLILYSLLTGLRVAESIEV